MALKEKLLKTEVSTAVAGDANFDPIHELEVAKESYSAYEAELKDLEAMERLEESTEAFEAAREVVLEVSASLPADEASKLKQAFTVSFEAMTYAAAELTADQDEDIAAFESAGGEGFLAKIWKGIKDTAKKVWTYVVEFVTRIVNFIKGLFGKKDTTGEALVELLDKLKEEKKVKLEVDKFEDIVASRLVKEVGLAAVVLNKKLDGNAITEFIKIQVTTMSLIEKAKKDEISDLVTSIADLPAKEAYSAVKRQIDSLSNKINCPTELNSLVSEIDTDKVMDGDYLFEGYVNELTPTKIGVIFEYANKEAIEEAEELAKEGKYGKACNKLATAIGSKAYKFNPDTKDVEDMKENIVPLSFAEAYNIAKLLKNVGKEVAKIAEKTKKNAEKNKKVVEKVLDKIEKEAYKNPDEDKINVMTLARKVVQIGAISTPSKFATGTASTAASIVRSPFGQIVKESTRLYTK